MFVATNEVNATQLRVLHSASYLTHVNVTNVLLELGIRLTMVENFGLEFNFMCHAKYFLFYGTSGVNDRVIQCRTENKMNLTIN